MRNYIFLTTIYLLFDFDPHKKEQRVFVEGDMYN